MRIVVLFGTESGTAEFVAEDVAKKLRDVADVAVSDMAEFPISNLSRDDFYVFICSTYGEGDPPLSAQPFLAALDHEAPDLTGVRYAIFGMGDSSYIETFCGGSEVVSSKMEARGAIRLGEPGRHDASSRDHPSDVAASWIDAVVRDALSQAAHRP